MIRVWIVVFLFGKMAVVNGQKIVVEIIVSGGSPNFALCATNAATITLSTTGGGFLASHTVSSNQQYVTLDTYTLYETKCNVRMAGADKRFRIVRWWRWM
jgi:hypothetical protein